MHSRVNRFIKAQVFIHLPSTKKEVTCDQVYPANQLFNVQVTVILKKIDKPNLQEVWFLNESISKTDRCCLTIFHKELGLQV